MKWALVENDLVKETTEVNPKGRFHKALQWVKCLDDTTAGVLFVDGSFIKQESSGDSSTQEESTGSGE